MPLTDVYTLLTYRFRALDADDCETSGKKVRTDFPEFHWVLSRHTAKLLLITSRGSMLNEQHLGPSSSHSFRIQSP